MVASTNSGHSPPRPRVWARLASKAARVRIDLPFAMLDAALIAIAFGVVLMLRFDGSVPIYYWQRFLAVLPLIIGVTLAMNWLWGLYGQLWRHASILEARRIILATASTGAVLATTMIIGDRLLPLSVVGLGCLLYTVLAGATRFQSRLFALHRDNGDGPGLRVVVIGAGEAGALIVREMQRNPGDGLIPVAMLDDDPRTNGRRCLGVPVVGPISDLPRLAQTTPLHQAVLAVGNPPSDLVRRAADAAEQAELPLRVLRGVSELVQGKITLRDIRDVAIEDLVGREQIVTNLDAVRTLLNGRRVLVTGAGGSIGAEIARQVADADPAALLVLDHDETHLYDLCAGLPSSVVETRTTQLLADVRDREQVFRLFRNYRPEIVFHAAAHKHVPVLEQHPSEAVRTNVLGTQNVVDAARLAGVQRLVFISTDKAVNPSCVMGASKRLGEYIVTAAAPDGGIFCAVRFGNVLGSRGSVIPTFLRQINSGGPVTVTDPRMTRYFMSIREAVQLVLQAATISEGRDVFVLEMGEQVRIIDLARRMIQLSGRRVGGDIEIEITGVRPGEKLVEELHSPAEQLHPTDHPAIQRLYPVTMDPVELSSVIERLAESAVNGRDEQARHDLFMLTGTTGQEVETSDEVAAVK